MLAIQDAAIAELEQKLGKPLLEALKEQYSAEQALRLHDSGVSRSSGDIAEIVDDNIPQLRATGASPDDVAREARNVFGEHLPDSILSPEERKIYIRLYGEPLPKIDLEEVLHDEGQHNENEDSRNMLYNAEGEEVRYRLENEQDIQRFMGRQSEKDTQSAEQASSGKAEVRASDLDVEAIAEVVQGNVYAQE